MTSNNPRRVLLLGEYGALNGGENSLLSVIPALQSFGWDFTAAVPAPSEFADALAELDVDVRPLDLHNRSGTKKTQAEKRSLIRQRLLDAAPALVHCNSLSTSRLCGPVAAELGVPSLGYLRDIIKISGQAIADLNSIDCLVAVSHATKSFHVSRGLLENKTHVVYNGVDTETFRPPALCSQPGYSPSGAPTANALRNELGLAVDSQVLLFVGQLGIRKGISDLVSAFLRYCQTARENLAQQTAELLIVGSRHSQKQEAVEYETSSRQLAASSEFAGHVHWLGRRSDVARLMQEADVLIHPAKQEPLGRVLLEAAASGLPMITTRVGGSAEILDGFESLLVQPSDRVVDEIAERLTTVLGPDEIGGLPRVELSARLRSLALHKFSVARCAEKLNQHYLDLAVQ